MADLKPTKTFVLSKTSKRIMSTIANDVKRHEQKNLMIQAELAAAIVPKKEKKDNRVLREPSLDVE